MVLRTRAKETVQVEFREVSQTGVFLATTKANHENSMALLRQNGFRPLIDNEEYAKASLEGKRRLIANAINTINQKPELKAQLKGKWFYLGGEGSELSEYYTINDNGEIKEGKGEIEKTVYVWKGNQPLSLGVRTDDFARSLEGRFVLNADDEPSGVAGVVVGVRAGHEVATPKIEVAQTEKPEEITLSGTSLDTFKVLHRGAEQELSKLTEALGSENLPNMRKLVEALRIKE